MVREETRSEFNPLLWRKQNHCCYSYKSKSPLDTGNRKPLFFFAWKHGYVNREGFQFKPVKTLTYDEPTAIKLDEAAKKLQSLLEESIKRRTRDVKEVAVAFSGGLDSSLVAYLASKLGLKVQLLHVSMENQPETEEAIEASN